MSVVRVTQVWAKSLADEKRVRRVMLRPFVFGQMMMMIMFGKMFHLWWDGGCWASSRQSSSSLQSHDDGHCPVTFIIEKWKWMKNISLCFVSEWQVLTAATFRLSSHLRLYSVPPFLDSTQTNDSPSGHIWSHENIHQLPPPSVQTRSHDVSDIGGWCDVRAA